MQENTSTKTNGIAIVTGKKVPRVEGPLKVTGHATYSSDFNLPNMAYAFPVCATIAKGSVTSIDTAAAMKVKGVLGVFTRENIGPLYWPTADDGLNYRVAEPRPPFNDNVIRYYGQYIAVVVAETFEIARTVARNMKVIYKSEKPNLSLELQGEDLQKKDSARGDADAAFKKSAVKIDQTYITPAEAHNPIELHATVAHWEKKDGQDFVTLYETSQSIGTHQNVMSQILGLPRENVRVITQYLGSGFGGKLWPWPQCTLAAATARKLQRPVKIVVDRQMMFMNTGYRPRTRQNIRISADASGKLTSLSHVYVSQTSMLEDYKENCGEVSSFLYSVPNVHVFSSVARRNKGAPTAMRGPGAIPGLFALESAMDELAVALKMDPVELRLKNDTQTDESVGKPFSSRHLKECLELGAKKFGWSKRQAEIGSMKDGDEILGWGVSACTWPARRLDAQAAIEFHADGKVYVKSGTHDIGTGMYTVLAQVTSEELGIPLNRIAVQLGDTNLPPGPIAGGSMATGSVIPAVIEAAKGAVRNLQNASVKNPNSPFYKNRLDSLKYAEGKIRGANGSVMDFADLLKKIGMSWVAGMGTAKGNFADRDGKVSSKSFGAQFVEIGWRPHLGRLRVRRVVSVMDGGRIINYQQAKNQIEGAIVMGVGMGLFEKVEFDPTYGDPINRNLADYVMPVHADCPEIDVVFLDYPDKEVNAYGARGIGEIGLAGIASSICSAVYHATGVRVRELPVSIEDLLKTKA